MKNFIKKEIYLIITPFFPSSTSFRGPYIFDQVKALDRRGKYDLIVLKPKSIFSKEEDYIYNGVSVNYFNVFALPSNFLPGFFDFISFIYLKLKIKKLGIDIEDITVVHAHATANGYYANALKKINTKIKTILQHHGFDVLHLQLGWFKNFKWHTYLVKRNSVKICNQIDLHIGVSAKTLSSLTSHSEILIKDFFVLYNGVDKAKFYPEETLSNKLQFKIGCIANFIPLKDQLTLIKAVHVLINEGINNISVEFIGSGPTLSICKKYIDENGLEANFKFNNEIDHSQLRTFYNTLDLFVMPSFYEAFGCVYVEAFACGIPFIAVENQGISELIYEEDKGKWLFEKSNYLDLANLIKENKKNREKQILTKSIEINDLIEEFLVKLMENYI